MPGPLRCDLAEPAHLHQSLHLCRARVSGQHERAALLLLPHERGVAGMDVGGEWLAEQRVAVVPDRDEAELRRGGVDRRPAADDDGRGWFEGPQQPAVALRVALPGIRAHQGLGRHQLGEHRGELLLVAVIGHDDDRRLAGGEGAGRELAERARPAADPLPVLGARHARSHAEGDPPAIRQCGLQLRGSVVGDGRRFEGSHGGIRLARQPRLLHARLALGDRQTEHVVRRPGRAVCDGAGEVPHLGGEHAHRRDHRGDVAQRTGVLPLLRDLDDEAGGETSGAAQRHRDALPRLDALDELRNAVVEQPIQLRERRIDENPGDPHTARFLRDRPRREGRRRDRCAPT